VELSIKQDVSDQSIVIARGSTVVVAGSCYRAHISVLTSPSEELLHLLTELVGWLQDVNNEISGNSNIAGDSATLAVQYEQSQVIQ